MTEGAEQQRDREEQKNTGILRETVSRSSKLGEMVVDMFGELFSTAAACMKVSHEQLGVLVAC